MTLDLPDLVKRANLFDEEAVRSLEALLKTMGQAPETFRWPEVFRDLAAVEREGLRESAARILGVQGESGVRRFVVELSESPEETGRNLGLRALGYLAPPVRASELAPLCEALRTPDWASWQAASVSLGRLGKNCPQALEVLLEGASQGLVERALAGLAYLCDSSEQALDVMLEAATSPVVESRLAAARALAEVDSFPEAGFPLLESLLADPCREVQILSLSALVPAATRLPEAVGRLRELAAKPDHPLRLPALRCLSQAACLGPLARVAVGELLTAAEPASLMAAAMGLSAAARGDLESCFDLIVRISRSDDPEVLTTLAEVLSEVATARPDGVAEMVLGLIRHGSGEAILHPLARLGGECGRSAGELVRLWGGEGDPVTRLVGLRASLGKSGRGVGEVYRLLESLTHFATMDEILASAADLSLALGACRADPHHLQGELELLGGWIDNLARFETERDPEEQSAIVRRALDDLDRLKERYQANRSLPEWSVFSHLAGRWKAVVLQTLFTTRRGAEVTLELADSKVERGMQSTASLNVLNRGPGAAYEVAIELAPSPQYTAQMGSRQLPSLPPGQSQMVSFAFTPTSPEAERFRLVFRARYADFADSARTVAITEEVACRPARFTPIPNPYVPGLPLELGSALFLGRDDVFSFVEENLRVGSQKRCLVLVGQRRMGKTSILKQLPLRLPGQFLPVLVDCQGLEHHGLGNLLCHLAHIIADAVLLEGIPCPLPELSCLQEQPLFTFEYGFLRPVVEALGERILLLAIDEFQALEEAVEGGGLQDSIFGFFRSLMQHQPRIFFLFSGLRDRAGSARDYWQPVFNVALRCEVGLLEGTYARELITKPIGETVRFDPLALDQLMELCNGHPYLTQLFCDRLINHLNDLEEAQVRPQNIHQVMPQVFSAGVNHFYSLWEDLSPRAQIVLIAISASSSANRFATLSAVARFIREKGIAVELEEVTTVLQQLLARSMIVYVSSQPPGYGFQVNLFRYWIEKEMLQTQVGGRLKWS